MSPNEREPSSEGRNPTVPASPADPADRRRAWTLGLAVAALGFLLYANTLGHGYVGDDGSVLRENRITWKGIAGIPDLLLTPYRHGFRDDTDPVYRPLSRVMFAFEWELFPDSPTVGHFMNVLLYAVSGLVLFFVLRRLLARHHMILPFAISLLFISHPIHTEAVANIKSRDEILALLFLLLALGLLLRHVRTGAMPWLAGSLGCYFLALLSKEGTITFLAVVPLVLWFFTDVPHRKNAALTGLFLVPALVAVLLRVAALGTLVGGDHVLVVHNVVVEASGPAEVLGTGFLVLGKYLLLLAFPHPLSSDYTYNVIPLTGLGDARALGALAVYAGLAVFAALRLRKKDLLSFCVLFFLAAMSLYSHLFVTIGTTLAERVLLVPSLAFCIAIGTLLARLLRANLDRAREGEGLGRAFRAHAGFLALVAVVVGLYSVKTVLRNGDWKSSYDLFAADVKKQPDSLRLHYFHGLELLNTRARSAATLPEKNRYLDLAIGEFETALRIYPGATDAHVQLGAIHSEKGDYRQAEDSYSSALRQAPGNPILHFNLATTYFLQKKFGEAERSFRAALRIDPHYADAWLYLGSTYGNLGRYDEAISALLTCLKHRPRDAEACRMLGLAYEKKGDPEKARYYHEMERRLKSSSRK